MKTKYYFSLTSLKIGLKFLFFTLFFASSAQAAAGNIIINEIGGFPTSTHEWVEIWNPTENPIDLLGWKFWENNTNHSLAPVAGGSAVLVAGQYGAICQDGDRFLLDHPGFNGLVMDSSWTSLSEAGEEIGLKDNANNFIEKFTYSPWSTASLEREDPFTADYTSANWQERPTGDSVGQVNSNFLPTVPSTSTPATSTPEVPPVTTTSTPATSTPITPTSTPEPNTPSSTPEWDKLTINEFVSNPESGPEWVEFYNSSSSTIDLTGVTLCDARAGSCTIASPTGTIVAGGWFTINLSSSYLNNDGDSIFLKNPSGNIIDAITYHDDLTPEKSEALARKTDGGDSNQDSDWSITITPTPNLPNQITSRPPKTPSGSSSVDLGVVPATTTVGVTSSTLFTTTIKSGVILNEIFPDPDGEDEEEFIEIKNISSSAVDINGWILRDKTTSFTLSGIINPQQIQVFYRKDTKIALNNTTAEEVQLFNKEKQTVSLVAYVKANNNESYNFDGTNWRWSLTPTPGQENIFSTEIQTPAESSSSSLILKLRVPTFAEVKESIKLSAVGSADKRGKALAIEWKIDNKILRGTEINYAFSQPGIYAGEMIASSTLGIYASKPFTIVVGEAALPKDRALVISEAYPNPEGTDDDEFIEILNRSGETFDISGWQLKNKTSRIFTFASSTSVAPKERLVFYRIITKITLNNTNDRLELVNNLGQTVDVISLGKAPEGKSFMLTGTKKVWANPSPGEEISSLSEEVEDENTGASPTTQKKTTATKKSFTVPIAMSIAETRAQPKDQMVKIQGQVTVLPGVFGSQYFYIQSASSGIQIYQSAKNFPTLKVGDVVQVIGRISEASGMKRVLVKNKTDIKFVQAGNLPAPPIISTTEINEENAGQLVMLNAEITEIKTNMMYVDDGEAEGVMYLKKGGQINKKVFKEGEGVEVVGIVEHASSGWQIWPRSQQDVVVKNGVENAGVMNVVSTTTSTASSDTKAVTTAVEVGVGTLFFTFLARFRGAMAWATAKKVGKVALSFIRKTRG